MRCGCGATEQDVRSTQISTKHFPLGLYNFPLFFFVYIYSTVFANNIFALFTQLTRATSESNSLKPIWRFTACAHHNRAFWYPEQTMHRVAQNHTHTHTNENIVITVETLCGCVCVWWWWWWHRHRLQPNSLTVSYNDNSVCFSYRFAKSIWMNCSRMYNIKLQYPCIIILRCSNKPNQKPKCVWNWRSKLLSL